jgi:hypothetical protein
VKLYTVLVDDKDEFYDFEAVLEVGLESCDISPEDFEIVSITCEDV